jgi:hypothetical protein
MDAPTCAILAEAYNQHMEYKTLYKILIKYQRIGYLRYVDIFSLQSKENKYRWEFGNIQ